MRGIVSRRFLLALSSTRLKLYLMFNLNTYFNKRRDIIDQALDREMPGINTPPERLHEAMRYSVFSGGKRLRPILCLAAAEAVGAKPEKAMLPAVAIEIFHTYTLIHDDLPAMDDDKERRGKPTSHVVYGEANAILAGDALQALSFEILARTPTTRRYPANCLVTELAQTAGSAGIVGGQFLDLTLTKNNLTPALIEYVNMHKTATLFRAAARLGAMAGNAGKRDLRILTDYAVSLGLAFQITDDLLDSNHKKEISSIHMYGLETARKMGQELSDNAVLLAKKLRYGDIQPLVAIAEFILKRTH